MCMYIYICIYIYIYVYIIINLRTKILDFASDRRLARTIRARAASGYSVRGGAAGWGAVDGGQYQK